ncbi:hypothetical protein [Ramlibacter alkalitolerans]|uniref:Uncharacterized protein n=1 Tax=Ramlibacter alkalitolerans TaxID=2039631 RepID=A0ABS1JUA0_9BURK|nr:hypothetical protein [Ramlibacter alkalitolerans]MBL0427833.1 hypothetical protein [Ramlibacter alkalitolerans]
MTEYSDKTPQQLRQILLSRGCDIAFGWRVPGASGARNAKALELCMLFNGQRAAAFPLGRTEQDLDLQAATHAARAGAMRLGTAAYDALVAFCVLSETGQLNHLVDQQKAWRPYAQTPAALLPPWCAVMP